MTQARFSLEPAVVKKSILLVSPIPILLYCFPAYSQNLAFGTFYLFSSLSFLAAFYLAVKVKISWKTLSPRTCKLTRYLSRIFSCAFIASLAPFSFYKIALVALGQATSLYTVTNKLQVTGETSFLSRIFTANMPLGLSIGVIFASLFLLTLPPPLQFYNFDVIISYGALLTSFLYLMSSGSLAPVVAILQMVVFALLPTTYQGVNHILTRFKLKKSSFRQIIFFAAIATTLSLLLNIYSQLKDLEGIGDVVFSYFQQVYDYQLTIYSYVLNEGTSNSAGLASLFPVNVFELGFHSLNNFKSHLDPVLLKGMWFGMTGRQLLEFGPFFQPFIMFASSFLYFVILKVASKFLLPPQYYMLTWYFLCFCMITAIWTSDPMTGIPVPLFTILSVAFITRLIPQSA